MNRQPLYHVNRITDLRDMINQVVGKYSDKAAFLVKKKEGEEEYHPISYRQFKHDIECLGTGLASINLKGKRIALIGENRYEWAVSYLAVINGIGVVVPIDKELPEHEIESLLERSGVSGVIFSGKFENVMRKIKNDNKALEKFINMDGKKDEDEFISFQSILKTGGTLIKNGSKEFLEADIDAEDMSVMLFTSGTTDLAKAVMLSQNNICSNIMAMNSMIDIRSDDIFLSFLPLHHTYECTCGFLTPLYRGAAIAYCEGLRHITRNLKEAKATMMLSVPLLFESMYKRIWDQASKKPGMSAKMKAALKMSNFLRGVFGIDLRKKLFKQLHEMLGGNIRLFISGAAAIDPIAAKGFRDFGIDFLQGYGLTECSPIVAVNRDVYFKDDAAGIPLPGIEVRIENTGGGDIGEIITKGPNVMMGYYNNEEATAKVLKDGWFYTGDLGYIDKDGFLHITGRKKNVIVTKNGKNVFPEELETLLNRSPYINESMVWGKPDKDGDVLICADIVPDKEYMEGKFQEALTEEQVRDLIGQEVKAVNKKLILYKHIREFDVREQEFIKTTTKKIKRHLELEKK